MDMLLSRRAILKTIAATAAFPGLARAAGPSRTITLKTPGGRAVTVTMWRAKGGKRGTIAFSHGALSAPWKYPGLIGPWVAAGFDVLAPLHVDSTDHPETKAFGGYLSWGARIEDMRALSHFIGNRRYIAAGHSYGALVSLTLGGASVIAPEGMNGPFNDAKVQAVVAFSPPGSAKGLIETAGYSTLAVPALIQTGDRDVPLGAPPTPDAWKTHLAPYDMAAPGGDRYALILDGVDHFFGGAICWLDQPGPPQLQQLAKAADVSTLFLNAFGRNDQKARALLDGRLTETGPVVLSRK